MENGLVLVIGGTGETGKLVIERLLSRGERVRVYARNPEKARALFGDTVDVMGGALTDQTQLARAIAGARVVVVSLNAKAVSWKPGPGPKQVNYQALGHILAAAKAITFTGRIVYVSSLYVLRRHVHPLGIMLNVLLKRALTWNYRAERRLMDSGLPYSIVRPGGLRDEPGGEYRIKIDQGDKIMGFISREDAADVIAAVALDARAAGRAIDCARDNASKGSAFDNDYAAAIAQL